MKTYLIAIIILLSIPFFGNSDLNSIMTTLVLIEESENNFMTNQTPFKDGVLDSLWQRPYIFFDMRLDSELEMVDENSINAKPFFGTAKSSGADSILLIKFQYDFNKIDNLYNIKIGKIPYLLYSLNNLKTLKKGSVEINMDKNITADEKRIFLKNLGRRILNLIYSSKG